MRAAAPRQLVRLRRIETQAEPRAPRRTRSLTRENGSTTAFTQPLAKRDKLTAPRLFQSLEQVLDRSKGDWNGIVVRDLWTSLEASQKAARFRSIMRRRGSSSPAFCCAPALAWRWMRAASTLCGASAAPDCVFPASAPSFRSTSSGGAWPAAFRGSGKKLCSQRTSIRFGSGKVCPPELIRMAGSFERIGHELKTELIGRFIETGRGARVPAKALCAYLTALGLLLNRDAILLRTGKRRAAARSWNRRTRHFAGFDWKDPEFAEAQVLFLRAARAVDDRRLDPPKSLRHQIADRLRSATSSPIKTGRLRKACRSSARNALVCMARPCRPA